MEPQALPGFERPVASRRDVPRPEGRIVRVQPDITSVTGAFDYEVPPAWEQDGRADRVAVGSMVRIDFSGRRTAGWVVEVDVEPTPGVEVLPLRRWSSVGPPAELIDLAGWAAWRWNGRIPHFLRAASPPRMVATVRDRPSGTTPRADPARVAAFDGPLTLVRTPPADVGTDLALAAASLGPALVLVPTIARRRQLVRNLRTAGVDVAEYNTQWERAAGGAVTVGTRLTAWAPTANLAAVLVLDEHDHAYKEERTPSWNARDVAVERAERLGIPCVLASATPSLESLERAERRLIPERSSERTGWPHLHVVDLRRKEHPGLLTDDIVDLVRGDGTVACVLNRKGRARMLACATCASLATCAACSAAVAQPDDAGLVCSRCGTERPVVCTECGGTKMKLVRPGISRIAEELRALAKREVLEITADTPEQDLRGDRLLIGTEAVLHRLESARAVIFLDFDQELAVPRVRAAEDAFALLGLAARLVGPRADGGRVVVQTRRPDDVVLEAALHGDPDRVARAQRDIRTVFHQPPYGAWALVSGAGAEAFIAELPETVRVLRNEDRWRVAAPDHPTLLDALAATPRPAERVRVVVDPLDA